MDEAIVRRPRAHDTTETGIVTITLVPTETAVGTPYVSTIFGNPTRDRTHRRRTPKLRGFSLTGNSPTDNVPAGNSPTDNVPADHSPTDNVPADHSPAEHVTPDHSPTDDVPKPYGEIRGCSEKCARQRTVPCFFDGSSFRTPS